MRPNRRRRAPVSLLAALLVPLAVGCNGSGSSSAAVLASSTIGPAGGVVTVDRGAQRGLVLIVPAGAVDQETEFRVVDQSQPVGTTGPAVSVVAPPGQPFRIEPRNLLLREKATLRIPFQPAAILDTAPGNVRVRQETAQLIERIIDPEVVDVLDGHVEIRTFTLDRFQCVLGPRVERLADYFPEDGIVAFLDGGWSLTVEPVDPASPFAAGAGRLWRLRGPSVDESLVVSSDEIVGRENAIANWREYWTDAYPWFGATSAQGGLGYTSTMQVEQQIGVSSTFPASLTLFGFWQFAPPRAFRDRLAYDVLRLDLDIAWQRPDIGTGQRQLTFWLAPEDGLLALSLDGVVRERFFP